MAYHTGLFAPDYSRFPRAPYRGNGWHANLIAIDPEFSLGSMRISGKTYPAKEVVIHAKTHDQAQRAANLIHAARLVLNASNAYSHIYQANMRQLGQWRKVIDQNPQLTNQKMLHTRV